MATQVQWRGGSTAEHATFTGAAREITVDTQKQTLVVHDGSTVGGEALLREDQANLPGSVTNGIYTPGTNQVAVATNGTGRLFVDATGNIGVGAAATANGVLRLNVASGNNANLVFSENNTDRYILGQVTGDNALRVYDIVAASERLRITSGGLVGIGTSSVSELLTVAGNARFDKASSDLFIKIGGTSRGGDTYSNYIDLDNNGFGAPGAFQTASKGDKIILWGGGSNDAEARIGFSLDDSVWVKAMGTAVPNAFAVHGAAANSGSPNRLFTITKTGAVGIGTTSPGFKLDVASASGSSTVSQFSFTGGNSVYLKLANASNTQGFIGYETQDLTFYNNNTESLRIDSSGRLLVGTSSTFDQSARLQVIADTGTSVAANFYSYGADNSQFFIGAARGTVASPTTLNSSDTIGGVYFRGHDGTSFKTGAQIQAQIDGITPSSDLPSRLVFSTTADGASSPTERMRIDSSGTHQLYGINDTLFSRTNRGAGTSYVTFAGVHSSTGPGTGTPSCFIYSNGNIQNTNNSYGAISDLKLKENIVDASSQWDDLKALQVRNYNFKEGQTHTQIGLVAQEAELVSPGLVSESPDRDAEGNDLGTVTKSVNYSVLYMKAVKALQEAMERIETLEAKVAALESA
jgi:hypothetical protein